MKKLVLIFLLIPLLAYADGVIKRRGGGGYIPSIQLDDSYSESNWNESDWVSTGYQEAGQSFASGGGELDSVKFYLRLVGSPTGNATAQVYAHTGTYGASSLPTGAVLATSGTLDVSTLTGEYQLITFNFTGGDRITLTASTNYVVTFKYTGGTQNVDYVRVGKDESSATHSGNTVGYDTGWLYQAANDEIFYLYVVR
jgi:hypothetical protein